MVSRVIKTCYISAPASTNLRELLNALRDRSISVINPSIEVGALYSQEITNSIQRADIVIGILSRERRSDWVLFELGLAWNASKRIILVIPPDGTLAPPAFNGLTIVRANPSNIEAITFAIDQLLSAPFSITTIPNAPKKSQIPKIPEDLEQKVQMAVERRDGRMLESLIRIALIEARIDVITPPLIKNEQSTKVDFAVWEDDLASTVGNPLLIEVKLELNSPRIMREAAQLLSDMVKKSGTRYGLLLYGKSYKPLSETSSLPFNVLALSIEDFLQNLRHRSFSSVLISLRNQRIHGAGG